MPTFTVSTPLPIAPEAFWARMSMAAVNAELWPWVHMTAPAGWRRCPLAQWTTERVLFRSVVLLLGVLPVDVHALRLAHIDPDRGFLEESSSWTNRLWRHERTTTRTERGCVVTDTVTMHGRVALLAALMTPIDRLIFQHRHRRLRRLHAGAGR